MEKEITAADIDAAYRAAYTSRMSDLVADYDADGDLQSPLPWQENHMSDPDNNTDDIGVIRAHAVRDAERDKDACTVALACLRAGRLPDATCQARREVGEEDGILIIGHCKAWETRTPVPDEYRDRPDDYLFRARAQYALTLLGMDPVVAWSRVVDLPLMPAKDRCKKGRDLTAFVWRVYDAAKPWERNCHD